MYLSRLLTVKNIFSELLQHESQHNLSFLVNVCFSSIFLCTPFVSKSIPCLIITTLSGYNNSVQSSRHFSPAMLFLRHWIHRFLYVFHIFIDLSSLIIIAVYASAVRILAGFDGLFLSCIYISVLFPGLNFLYWFVIDVISAILLCNKSLDTIPSRLLEHEKFSDSILKIDAWYWKVRVSPLINVCRK